MFLLSCWQKRFVSEDLCLWWCEQLMLWMWSYVKMPLRVMRDSESLQYFLWCWSLCSKLWWNNAGKLFVIFLRNFLSSPFSLIFLNTLHLKIAPFLSPIPMTWFHVFCHACEMSVDVSVQHFGTERIEIHVAHRINCINDIIRTHFWYLR